MNHIILGANGQGKTLYLNELQTQFRAEGERVISNLTTSTSTHKPKIDPHRLQLLTTDEAYEDIFDYQMIQVKEGEVTLEGDHSDSFSQAFFKILTAIISEGDILILDDIDNGLYEFEVRIIVASLIEVLPTFQDSYISTNNTQVFVIPNWVDGEFYLVSEYKVREITRGELNEFITQYCAE